jgi:hypothetical protein
MQSTKQGLLAAVAAAALIAGTAALAQDKGMGGQGQAPSAQSGSEQGGAKAEKDKIKGGATATQGSGKTQAQSPAESKTEKMDAKPGQAQQPGAKQPGQAQQKPDTQPRGQAQEPSTKQPGQTQMQPGQQKPGQAQQPGIKSETKAVQINEQQRTKISQTIKQQNVNLRRVSRSDVSFTINVGAVVPRSVNLVVLPAPLIAIVPQFRGYLYIVVDNQLLIIHPQTYEIVAVLPA